MRVTCTHPNLQERIMYAIYMCCGAMTHFHVIRGPARGEAIPVNQHEVVGPPSLALIGIVLTSAVGNEINSRDKSPFFGFHYDNSLIRRRRY